MSIVQIAPCFVDMYQETGGVANIIREICLALSKRRIKTSLICTDTELGKIKSDSRTYAYSDFLTVHIIHQHKNPLTGPIKNLKQLLKKINEVELVHIHTCFSMITEYSMNYFLGSVPIIFTPHGKLSPQIMNNRRLLKKIIFNSITKANLNKISEYVCSSVNEIKYANDLGIKCKKSYIYNGYRMTEGNDSRNNLGIKSKMYLLFLGYLDPRKQPDLLIRAFARSKAKSTYKLVLAGPDSYHYRSTLEKISKESGLMINKDVFLPGKVEGNYKWNLLRNAKALLLPSKAEGWPVTLAEAIGAEIPSLISKGCNFDEIEEFKIGLLVNNFSEKSWSDAIDKICFDNSLLEIFRINLMKYKNQFSWATITKQWIAKYKQIAFSIT